MHTLIINKLVFEYISHGCIKDEYICDDQISDNVLVH